MYCVFTYIGFIRIEKQNWTTTRNFIKSIVYIKGTWIHIVIRGEDVWDKLDSVYKAYKDKNKREPEGYLIQSDNIDN